MNDQQYRIRIDFHSSSSSIECKMKVMEMIDMLGVNDKVARIGIR